MMSMSLYFSLILFVFEVVQKNTKIKSNIIARKNIHLKYELHYVH